MSEIIFREVDAGRGLLKARVAELVNSELGGGRGADQILRKIDYGSGTTRIMGGFVGDELVCMNAFMRMRFTSADDEVFGYQSGFSATDKQHRGKGYWPKLLSKAESYLAGLGGAFIFGFPNPVSHPLFIRKLDYESLELRNLRILLLPVADRFGFGEGGKGAAPDAGWHRIMPDQVEIAQWKRRSGGEDLIVEVRRGGSYLWGVKRSTRKWGLLIRFLEIGGFKVDDGESMRDFFRDAAKQAGVRMLYLSMNPENLYASRLQLRQYGQPVIVKAIGGFKLSPTQIDFFGGMRDTF